MADATQAERFIRAGHSLPDLIAAMSAGALCMAAVYYWGFFARLNTSLISSLAIPDLLLGALVGVVPMLLGVVSGASLRPISDSVGVTSPNATRWSQFIVAEKLFPPFWFIFLPAHLAAAGKGGLGVLILVPAALTAMYFVNTTHSVVYSYALVIMVFSVGMGFVFMGKEYNVNAKNMIVLIVLTLLCCSYSLGRAGFNMRMYTGGSFQRDAVVLQSGGTFFGKVLLFTSTSVILAGNSEFVQFFPLSEVKLVKSGVSE